MAGPIGRQGPLPAPPGVAGARSYGAGGAAVGGGWGGGPSSPAGGAPPTPQAVPIAFPPEYMPPLRSTDFQLFGANAGQVIASGVVELDSIQLPAQNVGIIRSVTLGVGALTADANIHWRVTVGGGPAPGLWGDMTIAPRGAAFVSVSYLPEEVWIRLPRGTNVALTVQVVAGAGAYNVSGQLHGWSWPEGQA